MIAIEKAELLAVLRPSQAAAIGEMGQGWIAEEALGISLHCALSAADFESGVVLAINHGGDSDSTGAITGNLLGVAMGIAAEGGRGAEIQNRVQSRVQN